VWRENIPSDALEADAPCIFSTDVWSTIVVIAGIGLVWAGETWNLPWLNYADALAGPDGLRPSILWVARSSADARWMPCWTRRRKGCSRK